MPLIVSIPLIVACITNNAITADNTATSFDFFVIPSATDAAKIIGKLSKTIFPTSIKRVKN